jgi:hypothetical protein
MKTRRIFRYTSGWGRLSRVLVHHIRGLCHKSQNRLSADERTLVGSRNPMIKSLNLEAINYRVLTVSSLSGKRSVLVNGSLTARTKSSTKIPWEFASLRHLSEKNEGIAISSVLGTGGPVSKADIPTLAQHSWRPWKAQGLRSRPKVRSYIAELDHALSTILVPDQRLNMDETRFYSARWKLRRMSLSVQRLTSGRRPTSIMWVW